MNKSFFEKVESRHRFILLFLLGFNMIFKLLLFSNATRFLLSEAGSNFHFLEEIEKGRSLALYEANYRSILAHIGHFFKTAFGTLDAYFWFQAFLATLSVFIIYLLCLRLTEDKTCSLFAVLLATIQIDYHLLTPVFYYQIFEIFFVLTVVYLVLIVIDGKKGINPIPIVLIPVLIYSSSFFRGTMAYFSWLLIGMSVYFLLRKNIIVFIRLAAAGMLTIILFSMIPHRHFRNVSAPSGNDFVFFGHTMYGGNGGEGAFIYKDNEARYNRKLAEFMKKRHFKSNTIGVRNEFQRNEIKEFITKTPQKWLWLQVRKVAYTFGIIPIRDSLELLTTGKLPLKWYHGAIVIQIPYVFTLLVFLILTTLFFQLNDLKHAKLFFVFLVMIYLIAATCLYGQYQERYRIVVIMAGVIPLSAFYCGKYLRPSSQRPIEAKKYILLILIMAMLFSHWGYQAYEALVINKDRYIKALNK